MIGPPISTFATWQRAMKCFHCGAVWLDGKLAAKPSLRVPCLSCEWHKERTMRDFTLDERTTLSRAFSAGNYANAYESQDLSSFDLDDLSEEIEDLPETHREIARAAFVLGFFGSYTLDEIGSDREIFDECYFSDAGQYVVKIAKYTSDRVDEYRAESDGEDGDEESSHHEKCPARFGGPCTLNCEPKVS